MGNVGKGMAFQGYWAELKIILPLGLCEMERLHDQENICDAV